MSAGKESTLLHLGAEFFGHRLKRTALAIDIVKIHGLFQRQFPALLFLRAGPHLCANGGQRFDLRLLTSAQANKVITEVGRHHLTDLADIQGKSGTFKGRDHGAAGEEAEIAALRAAPRIFRIGPRQSGKVFTLLSPLPQLFNQRPSSRL